MQVKVAGYKSILPNQEFGREASWDSWMLVHNRSPEKAQQVSQKAQILHELRGSAASVTILPSCTLTTGL